MIPNKSHVRIPKITLKKVRSHMFKNVFKNTKLKSLTLCALTAASLGACGITHDNPYRTEVASRHAAPAWLNERTIPVAPYNLTAYERMHERNLPVTLYIEGDGAINADIKPLKDNATPTNPVALHLATRDKSKNLAYLARPCQYSGMLDADATCDEDALQLNAYSPETLNAYNTALNKMKRRYGLTSFHLVGYDSGATLAALIAANRNDILSLRTVSGEFDLEHLTPIKTALLGLPQHHFAGGQDEINPPAELHSYLQMLGPNDCTENTLIQEATHSSGWVDKWPELLRENVPVCASPIAPTFVPIEKPEPIYYPRDIGDLKK
jgi:hypothetical protein